MTALRSLLCLACLVMPAAILAEPMAPASKPANVVPAMSVEQRGKNLPSGLPAEVPAAKRRAWVLKWDGVVDPDLAKWIRTNTEDALKAGATHIVYEIDTPGGLLISANDIFAYITQEVNSRAYTAAYVPKGAYSAGSLISLACREIFVGPHGQLGDSAPVMINPMTGTYVPVEGVEREKSESPLRASFRTGAQHNGYPEVLCEAMVTRTASPIYRVFNTKAGRYEYFRSESLPADKAVYDLDAKQIVLGANQLLTLTAAEAYRDGIATAIVDDVGGVLKHLGVPSSAVEKRELSRGAENSPAQYEKPIQTLLSKLDNPFVAGVLLAFGVVGLLIGVKTGEVQALIMGILGFTAFFWIKSLTGPDGTPGTAEPWEILLTIAGMICIFFELMFFPTMGALLLAGGGMFLVGLVLCFLGPLFPAGGAEVVGLPTPAEEAEHNALINSQLTWAMASIFGGLAAASVGTWLVLQNLHRIPYLKRAVLAQAETEAVPDKAGAPAPAIVPILAGELGRADTALRPVGKGRFGDRLLDVVADGSFVNRGDVIEVAAVEGNRILVRKVD